ncbi:MAG TPA: helix-turn-helix domain-containing protein [Acidimicrobiia bacterium]
MPDYDLAHTLELTTPDQAQDVRHPPRTTILGFLSERAATVTEVARAVGHPKSTVAYHVIALHEAGLIRVVRIQRVQLIRSWSVAHVTHRPSQKSAESPALKPGQSVAGP